MPTGDALSNYAENLLLKWLLTTGSVTRPTAWYIALHTADPTDAGTGTEVSGGSYTRMAATFGEPASGTTANNATITFPTASASWGTLTHLSIWDASTAGNMLMSAPLTASAAIGSGTTYSLTAGNITASLA